MPFELGVEGRRAENVKELKNLLLYTDAKEEWEDYISDLLKGETKDYLNYQDLPDATKRSVEQTISYKVDDYKDLLFDEYDEFDWYNPADWGGYHDDVSQYNTVAENIRALAGKKLREIAEKYPYMVEAGQEKELRDIVTDNLVDRQQLIKDRDKKAETYSFREQQQIDVLDSIRGMTEGYRQPSLIQSLYLDRQAKSYLPSSIRDRGISGALRS